MTENKSSKFLLPLIEIITALCIFIIAAIITLQLFFLALFMGEKTKDKAWIILEVQNLAEEIKSQNSTEYIDAIINQWSDISIKADINTNAKYIPLSKNNKDFELTVIYDIQKTVGGFLYNFEITTYKMTPYPFIDDKYKNNEKKYHDIPFTDTVHVSKFVPHRIIANP